MNSQISPAVQILLGYSSVVVFALSIAGGSVAEIKLIPLAAIIGPFMLIGYPFPFDPFIKAAWCSGLPIFAVIFYIGWKKRESIWGRVEAVIGLCGWTLVGMVGLSLGT